MNKSTFFTGQPIFNQLLNFIPRSLIVQISQEERSDRYCKRFTTYDHLVTMLFSVYNNCDSLREVTTGLLAWEQRIQHLGLINHPRRSTISDANKRRSEVVFEKVYIRLLQLYTSILSDSPNKRDKKGFYIFDSTSITLFKEILKGSGLVNATGRSKGGIKVHTLIKSDQNVPCMVRFSSAASNDSKHLRFISIPKHSVVVFDRGYPDYRTYNRFSQEKITWVTRLRKNAIVNSHELNSVTDFHKKRGILKDQLITLGHSHQKTAIKVAARLVTFKDEKSGKVFEFITNNRECSPVTIAEYYKRRWQIELLFKRFKQNYPLKYFLGDNENAIKIQIWSTLIADLIVQVIKKTTKTKLAYSTLAAMIRLHMMTYLSLIDFIRSPEKSLIRAIERSKNKEYNYSLFPT